MTLSSGEAIPLIRTKLHQHRMSEDLVTRSHLIDSLNDGLNRKLTLVSAPTGFRKTTLIANCDPPNMDDSAALALPSVAG